MAMTMAITPRAVAASAARAVPSSRLLRCPRRKRQAITQVSGPSGRPWLFMGLPFADLLQEPVEDARGVVRPRRGLGMVLHREHRPARNREALDRAVVQVDLRHLAG